MLSARVLRLAMNLWPPFLGAGIRVLHIADDFREVRVALRMRLLNRNCFGTHFGGSLFAMTDPFHTLMLVHNLGRGYTVWDQSSRIHYRMPARGTVFAHFRLSEEMLEDVRKNTVDSAKYRPTYAVDVVDRDGRVIATIEKTLYIRRTSGHVSATR
jgi:acyl-coenzyme A thioesterase PaaI-like protein